MTTQLNPFLLLAVPLASLAGAAIAGMLGTKLLGNKVSRVVSHTAAIFGVLISFILSVHTLIAVTDGARFDAAIYTWMAIDGLKLEVGFLVDSLTATMMCVVTFVSLMVHVYTVGYMSEDEGYSRFFSYLSLFTFAMLMLVMSNNFVQLFFGWEAVGLMSYLLIGFWHDRPSAIAASLKAFVVNRVGDLGFILGIGLLFAYAGSMHYGQVFSQGAHLAEMTLPGTTWQLLSVTCICLFIGAMAKSAQFPLHVWLPDSMEGPTPISALIHAATMVTAGIFMVARMSPLFELSDAALTFVMAIGAFTALMTGVVAVTQNDIKRVIAYSTLSQLGYMTVALGASAYSAAIFHLTTHAFFKALLFLGAGAVILAMHHDQDIRNMGGLRKSMPITWVTSIMATLALVGLPFFSGFYSKESIIEAVRFSRLAGSGFAYACVLLCVFVTGFYSFRLLFVVFHGEERFGRHDSKHHGDPGVGLHQGERPKEAPWVMTVPLVLLAIPAVGIGSVIISPMLFGGFFAEAIAIGETHRAIQELTLSFPGALAMALHGFLSAPFFLALAGGIAAWYVCIVRRVVAFNPKLDMATAFDAFLVGGGGRWARGAGRILWGNDRIVIDDFIVNGSGRLFKWFAAVGRRWQSGRVYRYALVMILGVLGFLLCFVNAPFIKQ